ncbi:MAG: hypothetical protein RIC35_24635 [Marinoscillum sp.]
MTLRLTLLAILIVCNTVIFGQVDTTAVTQEPEASQKVILYSMTIVGVILIGLAFRNSKWGRRSKK